MKGKTVVITGGTSGIGEIAAERRPRRSSPAGVFLSGDYRIKLAVANAVSSKFAAPFALLPLRDADFRHCAGEHGRADVDPQRGAFKAASVAKSK